MEYLLHEFVDILVGFFRGQLLIAFLQGLLFAVGFSLIGLRYGFVIGMALGMLNIVPYLGSMVGLAVALPIAFFQADGGLSTCLLLLVVFAVVQQFEGWFLTPRIMGSRTGLHFMAIVVAILFWGHGVRQRPGTGPGDSADRLPGVALALGAREEVHSRGHLLTGAACTAGH